jgi:hypothetical protein
VLYLSGAGERGIPDEDDLVFRDGGQEPDGHRVPDIEGSAECARDEDPVQIGDPESRLVKHHPDAALDGSYGQLIFADVRLGQDDSAGDKDKNLYIPSELNSRPWR